jgi:hypothetical protein
MQVWVNAQILNRQTTQQRMCFNTDQVNPPTRQTHKRIASTTSTTSKPANQQTSKPANQQTSKPANQQTSKHDQTKPAILQHCQIQIAMLRLAMQLGGGLAGSAGLVGLVYLVNEKTAPAEQAQQPAQPTQTAQTEPEQPDQPANYFVGRQDSLPVDQPVQPALTSLSRRVCYLELEKHAGPAVADIVASHQARSARVSVNTDVSLVQIVCQDDHDSYQRNVCAVLRDELAACLGTPTSFACNELDLSSHDIDYEPDQRNYIYWLVRFHVDQFARQMRGYKAVELVTTKMTTSQFAASRNVPACFWDGSRTWCTPTSPTSPTTKLVPAMMLDKQALEYLMSKLNPPDQPDQPEQDDKVPAKLLAKILLHDSTCFDDVRAIRVGDYTLDKLYDPPDEHNVMHVKPEVHKLYEPGDHNVLHARKNLV